MIEKVLLLEWIIADYFSTCRLTNAIIVIDIRIKSSYLYTISIAQLGSEIPSNSCLTLIFKFGFKVFSVDLIDNIDTRVK
jgi:hypothetical protein